ncbi:hypothetical protein HIM_01779 [Hirsutella minnesotensis 3608]|nr:hypothetical protein HIM_01779 [Hirsutella minnesotensis 3608]
MPRNESPENTMMRDVPPGDETGIYHIIISGLPFGTIWQLLKDWLRQAGCDVDHIEIFQKSTSGWVRLIGRDNFERALYHLQMVPYNNRLLIYLDKNRSEPVKIMELINDPPPKPKLGGNAHSNRHKGNLLAPHGATLVNQRVQERCWPRAASGVTHATVSAVASPSSDSIPTMCYRDPLTDSPLSLDYALNRSSIATDSFLRSVWVSSHCPAPPGYPFCQQHDHTAAHKRDQEPEYCRLLRPGSYEGRCAKPTPWAGNPVGPSDGSLRTPHDDGERFKVQILSMRQSATRRDVEEWARSSMGEWASAISRVDITSDQHRGRSRGAGYVTFLSAAAARRAVELLDTKPFLGRTVRARLVDDVAEGKHQAEHDKQVAACDTAPAAHLADDDDKGAEAAPKDSARRTNARLVQPVIAHGTNFYRPK